MAWWLLTRELNRLTYASMPTRRAQLPFYVATRAMLAEFRSNLTAHIQHHHRLLSERQYFARIDV